MLVAASKFGERLKELRTAAQMTQPALAQKSGLTKQAISRLEKGDTEPTWDTVRRLARALDRSVSDFDVGDLPESEEPEKKSAAKKKPKK